MSANAARGPPTLDDFNQLLAGLGQVISTLSTLKEYADLAKDLPLIGESVGTFTKFIDGIQATYDLISAYIASHPAPRLDEIAALLLGRIDNPSVTPVTDETQIALQITHRGSQSTSLPLSLGTAGSNLGLSLDGTASVTGTIAFDYTIGVRLDATTDRFFLKVTKLELGGTVALNELQRRPQPRPARRGRRRRQHRAERQGDDHAREGHVHGRGAPGRHAGHAVRHAGPDEQPDRPAAARHPAQRRPPARRHAEARLGRPVRGRLRPQLRQLRVQGSGARSAAPAARHRPTARSTPSRSRCRPSSSPSAASRSAAAPAPRRGSR